MLFHVLAAIIPGALMLLHALTITVPGALVLLHVLAVAYSTHTLTSLVHPGSPAGLTSPL